VIRSLYSRAEGGRLHLWRALASALVRFRAHVVWVQLSAVVPRCHIM